MSVDHHLEPIGTLMPVLLADSEVVLQVEQKRSRSANFLRCQSLLHRNRAQNPNACSSKAENELNSMKLDVKKIVGAAVGQQDHLYCEMLD